MAGEKSKKPSRKTTTTKNKRAKKTTAAKADKEPTKTGGFQRLELERTANAGMERLPSNAPTMAIAPSDYEHIFHEGAAAPQPPRSPSAGAAEHEGWKTATRSPQPDYLATAGPQSPQAFAPPPQSNANFDLQVTPDGYTLMGQPQLDLGASNVRRVAFPPHIVRANNQFSRAALARVAKYLAGRSEF